MAVVQPILSRGGFGGSANGQCLTNQLQFSSSFIPVPIAVAGSFSNWRVQTSVLGEDITITIEKNGSSTALSLTFTAGETVKTDSDSVSFAAGDTFEIQRTSNPGGVAYSRIDWTPDDGESQLYAFTCPEFVSGRYIGVLGTTGGDEAATENTVSSLVGVAGTITGYRIAVGSDPGVGKSRVFTLYKNGVAQDGSGGTTDTRATNSAGTTTASATFSLAVVAGDRVSLGFTATGGATNPDMGGSLAFVGATETVMYGGATTESLASTAGTSYRFPYPGNGDTSSATESDKEAIGGDGITIGGMRVYLVTAPSAGQSRVFTLRKNGADTDLSVTLSDTTQAGVDTATAIAIGYGDEWSVKEVRTGTPLNSAHKVVFTSGSTLSTRNALIGEEHTASASVNNLIVGKQGTTTGVSQVALFNMKDSDPYEWDASDNAFIVRADTIEFNGVSIDDLGGSSAPVDGQYVTIATNATLTHERVLTAGAGVTVTDGGAGSTVTIAANGTSGGWSILTNGDPVSPEVIFDSNGDTIGVFEP